MKYIIIAFLLVGITAQGQQLFQWPQDGAHMNQLSPNLAQVTNVVVTLSRRLDSLTHAFQTMHDSLMQLEAAIGPWSDFFRPERHSREPFIYRADSSGYYWGRDDPSSPLHITNLNYAADAASILCRYIDSVKWVPVQPSAPKKKRRKG